MICTVINIDGWEPETVTFMYPVCKFFWVDRRVYLLPFGRSLVLSDRCYMDVYNLVNKKKELRQTQIN